MIVKFCRILMLVEEWLNLKLLYSHQILRRQNLHPRRQTPRSDHAYQLHFTLFNMNNVFFLFLVQTFFKSLCYLIRPIFIPLFILPWSSFLFVPSFAVVNQGTNLSQQWRRLNNNIQFPQTKFRYQRNYFNLYYIRSIIKRLISNYSLYSVL